MKRFYVLGAIVCMLVLTASLAVGQGRYQQRPDLPMGTYGYGRFGYTPYGYGPPAAPFAPVRPWSPRMTYDPSTGLWYPPGGGLGRRYDTSAVRVFDPWLGGEVYVPEDVYESGVWEEAPHFRFEDARP
jgi:hypothetical protein